MFLREEQTSKSGFVRVIISTVEHRQRQRQQHRHQRPLVQQIFCPKKMNQIRNPPASTITNCCENVCRPQLNVGFNYFGFFLFQNQILDDRTNYTFFVLKLLYNAKRFYCFHVFCLVLMYLYIFCYCLLFKCVLINK